MSIKLKQTNTCGECSSCIDLMHNGKHYCNMKASDPKYKEMDISTCEVDPNSKPDDCPWNKVAQFVDSLGPEDQMGLKFITRMFSGGDQSLFEEEAVMPTIGKWIETDKLLPNLPNDRDWYLGMFQELDTGWINPIPFICDYVGHQISATTKEGWIIHNCTDVDNPLNYYLNLHCVAWMPLPKSYLEM